MGWSLCTGHSRGRIGQVAVWMDGNISSVCLLRPALSRCTGSAHGVWRLMRSGLVDYEEECEVERAVLSLLSLEKGP